MNVKWLFGKREPAETPAVRKDISRDGDRRGPVPPPPRTVQAPGVTVYRFDQMPDQNLLRWGEGSAGFFLEGEEGSAARLMVTAVASGEGADLLRKQLVRLVDVHDVLPFGEERGYVSSESLFTFKEKRA